MQCRQPLRCIPPEILYDILAELVSAYIDEAIICEPSDPNFPYRLPQNNILPLFYVSFIFRDTVTKILSDALGIKRGPDGRLLSNPWKFLQGIRKVYRCAYNCDPSFHLWLKQDTSQCSPLVCAYFGLVLLTFNLRCLATKASNLIRGDFPHDKCSFYELHRNADKIKQKALRERVMDRTVDFIGFFYMVSNLLTCTGMVNIPLDQYMSIDANDPQYASVRASMLCALKDLSHFGRLCSVGAGVLKHKFGFSLMRITGEALQLSGVVAILERVIDVWKDEEIVCAAKSLLDGWRPALQGHPILVYPTL